MVVCICSPLPLEANVSLDFSALKDHGKWQNVPLVNTAPPLDSGPRQETVLLATTAPRVLPHPSRWTVRSAITVPQEVVSQNPVVTEPTDPPLGFSRMPSALPVTVVCTVTAPVSVLWLDPVTLVFTAPLVSLSPILTTIDVHLGTTAWPIPALRSDVPVGSSRTSMKKTPVKSVQKVNTLPNSTKLSFENSKNELSPCSMIIWLIDLMFFAHDLVLFHDMCAVLLNDTHYPSLLSLYVFLPCRILLWQ